MFYHLKNIYIKSKFIIYYSFIVNNIIKSINFLKNIILYFIIYLKLFTINVFLYNN